MNPQLLKVVLSAPLYLPQTGPASCWPFFYLPAFRAAVIWAHVMPNCRDNAAGFTPACIYAFGQAEPHGRQAIEIGVLLGPRRRKLIKAKAAGHQLV